MPKQTISATGDSEALQLYEGTNKITVLVSSATSSTVVSNGIETMLPEEISESGLITESVEFLMNGPGSFQLDVYSLTGTIDVIIEKSHN